MYTLNTPTPPPTPGQNGLHFAFLNEDDKIPIQITLKLVPRSLIDNKPVLVQVMAWRRTNAHRGETGWANALVSPSKMADVKSDE